MLVQCPLTASHWLLTQTGVGGNDDEPGNVNISSVIIVAIINLDTKCAKGILPLSNVNSRKLPIYTDCEILQIMKRIKKTLSLLN